MMLGSLPNPDQAVALRAVRAEQRPAVDALWRLDAAFGAVLATGTQPMIGGIRLAWWREALEWLDRAPPPAEPVLQSLAEHVLPAGISGAALAEMEEGWAALLEDGALTASAIETHAAKRGGLHFRYTAALLEAPEPFVEPAGEAWALVDLARRTSDAVDQEAALATARTRALPTRWPRALRPLGMLTVLAARDLAREPARWEPPGAPPRVARMLRHRLAGW